MFTEKLKAMVYHQPSKIRGNSFEDEEAGDNVVV